MNYIVSRLEFLKLEKIGKLSVLSFFCFVCFFIYKEIKEIKENGSIKKQIKEQIESIKRKRIFKKNTIDVLVFFSSSLFIIGVLPFLSLSLFFVSLDNFLTGVISLLFYSFVYSFVFLSVCTIRNRKTFDRKNDITKHLFFCFKVFLFKSVFFMSLDKLILDKIKFKSFIFLNFCLYSLALLLLSIINYSNKKELIQIYAEISRLGKTKERGGDLDKKMTLYKTKIKQNYRYIHFFYFSLIFFYFFKLKYKFLSFFENLSKDPIQFIKQLKKTYLIAFTFIIFLIIFFSFDLVEIRNTKEEKAVSELA